MCPMVPRDKCSLAHVEVKMGNVFIRFDWPFYGRPEGGKKRVRMRAWEGVLAGRPYVCVDNRVHDKHRSVYVYAPANPSN